MSYDIKGLGEECGVFGVFGHQDASQLTYYGLHSLQHRGQEGAGIVSNQGEGLAGHRDLGLLHDVFSNPADLARLTGTSAIGHVRYGTSGNGDVNNIQPFLFKFYDGDIALAHNGNLINANTLRQEVEKEGAIFQSNSDTEILMHLIRRSKQPIFEKQLKEALNQLKGGFAYLVLTSSALYAALDPNGFRPLSIGKMGNGSYVVGSETCAIDTIGATFVRDVEPGELIKIDKNGLHIDYFTKDVSHAICSMEYIYFARPDSTIKGINVHSARKRTGKQLAAESYVEADMVIGVPNSSLSAASGYAEESGIPYEMGLVKNQYVARTFIQPTQALREEGVKMKLSAVRGVVCDQRVILVDDSIVRGTTIKRIVHLLKEAGAKEVHVKIASPPLKYPCFYGIDIQTQKELMAANYSVDEMCELIGADSLSFISEAGLVDAIGLELDAPNKGLCMAYFNGEYPTDLYDYELTEE